MGFFSGTKRAAKATGKGFFRAAKFTARSASKIAKTSGEAIEHQKQFYNKGVETGKKSYIRSGKLVAEHRQRVLAREEYRLKRLELRGAQQEKRQLLIPRQHKGPLSDRSLKPVIRNASAAGIRKVKGPGPLSDKNFSKKVKQFKEE